MANWIGKAVKLSVAGATLPALAVSGYSNTVSLEGNAKSSVVARLKSEFFGYASQAVALIVKSNGSGDPVMIYRWTIRPCHDSFKRLLLFVREQMAVLMEKLYSLCPRNVNSPEWFTVRTFAHLKLGEFNPEFREARFTGGDQGGIGVSDHKAIGRVGLSLAHVSISESNGALSVQEAAKPSREKFMGSFHRSIVSLFVSNWRLQYGR